MPMLRIAQAQVNPIVGDFVYNVALVARGLARGRQAGADLVTFPELMLSGYPPEDLLLKPRFLHDSREALRLAIGESRGITALIGFPEEDEGRVYNAAALVQDGRLLATYRKIELPNYGVFDEKRYFAPGTGCLLFDLKGMRFLATICEDLWVEGGALERCAQESGVQATLNISGSPFHAGKLDQRRRIIARFARNTGSVVFYNNLVGGQDELVFDGGSLVMAPREGLLALARRFEEDFLVHDLVLPPADPAPAHTEADRYCDLGGDPAALPGPPPAGLTGGLVSEEGPVEEVYRALVLGTRDYVGKNGFQKVLLGLSGGIDSALTAAIAVDALGAGNVVGVTMPSRYTSAATKGDAERLAANLGMACLAVPIEGIFAAYLKDLAPALEGEAPGVVAENLQARIRGNLLMALSNRHGWLVLTTGNKSETAVGYCTLYGDMAGGFAVIKDVPKTLVYALAAHLNRKAGREVIPRSVIDRPPTAELRPDQKDTDSLPPYEVLDPILRAYVEEDKVLAEIDGAAPEVVRRVLRMVDLNEYKRRQAPPGVKITPKAFGRDRRLPITNHYHPGCETS